MYRLARWKSSWKGWEWALSTPPLNRWVEWALPKHVFEISLSFSIPFVWCRFTVKRGSTDSLKKNLVANLDSALGWRVEMVWVLYNPPDFFFPKNWMLRLKASNFSILEMSNWYSNFELPKPNYEGNHVISIPKSCSDFSAVLNLTPPTLGCRSFPGPTVSHWIDSTYQGLTWPLTWREFQALILLNDTVHSSIPSKLHPNQTSTAAKLVTNLPKRNPQGSPVTPAPLDTPQLNQRETRKLLFPLGFTVRKNQKHISPSLQIMHCVVELTRTPDLDTNGQIKSWKKSNHPKIQNLTNWLESPHVHLLVINKQHITC